MKITSSLMTSLSDCAQANRFRPAPYAANGWKNS